MARVVIRATLPPSSAELDPIFREAMQAASVKAISIIRQRTSAGRDMDGGAFAPYTSRYRLLKASTGRSGAVDLTLTGQMLNNLKPLAVGTRRAVIGFEGQHRVTRFGKRSKRDFVSDRESRKTTGKRTLKRSAKTTTMAAIVLGLSRKRRFFGITLRSEIDDLVSVYQRVLDRGLLRLNARNK